MFGIISEMKKKNLEECKKVTVKEFAIEWLLEDYPADKPFWTCPDVTIEDSTILTLWEGVF